MKILLIGEYSNVHWSLAEGLRSLGHRVCVMSNGDFWKNYKRDISLVRKNGKIGGITYLMRAYTLLPKLCGYDIVQIINPMFLELKAERIFPFYNWLKKHNKKLFMGAFGMDAFWVKYATTKPYNFRYSDFNIGEQEIVNDYTTSQIADWSNTAKARLNYKIADECNGIIAGMYEYYVSYQQHYRNKLTYIPFPVSCSFKKRPDYYTNERKIRFFIGIQRSRSIYKGTDIMLHALEKLQKSYPNDCEIIKAENVPFEQYTQMVEDCDILLDQIYGYSPGMNALLALSKGKIVIGGAEEECYRILNEEDLRPMINVYPSEDDVYKKLEMLVLNKESIVKLQRESIEFVKKHHNPEKVAQQYIDFWNSK